MGKSFIKTSASHKKAYSGFLPVPGPTASITKADATTVVAAVVQLSGIWNPGDFVNIEITTNIPATTNTITSSQVAQTSLDFAKLVAIDLSLETDVTATAVGETVEVVASGAAVSLLIDSIAQ